MKPFNLRHVITGAMLIMSVAPAALAAPISGRFVDDTRGDAVAGQMLTRELGDVAMFPAVEAIAYHDHRYSFTVGAAPDGVANEWTVHITNVSGQAWTNLFFVADQGITIGNADGVVEDLAAAPGAFTDAFRIDGTVTGGANVNLLSESLIADEIFQPGEEWEFAVANFGTGLNSLPPALSTPGVFAGSSPSGPSNASILATPVPEPAAMSALVVCTTIALARRRRRAPQQVE